MKIYEFFRPKNLSSRLSLSLYFFLFFIGFVFGNLFPIICTNAQPFGYFFRFPKEIMQRISEHFFKSAESSLNVSSSYEDDRPLKSISLTEPNVSHQNKVDISTKLSVSKPDPAKPFVEKHQKGLTRTLSRESHGNFRPESLQREQKPRFVYTSVKSTELPEKSEHEFDVPNLVSAILLVLVYEIFSFLEKYLQKKDTPKLLDESRETSSNQFKTSFIQFKRGWGFWSPENLLNSSTKANKSALSVIFDPFRLSQTTLRTCGRVLRTLKIGFFLGLFVDAFKVGS